MGRCTRTAAAITSIAVPPTSRRNVWSNVWPTLATSWRSSRSPPEPCLRHHQQEELAATSEPVSFFLGHHIRGGAGVGLRHGQLVTTEIPGPVKPRLIVQAGHV